MTAQEKAVEIVSKYIPLVYPYCGSDFMTGTESDDVKLRGAKECALIAIDEILKAGQQSIVDMYFNDEWWVDVRRAISHM